MSQKKIMKYKTLKGLLKASKYNNLTLDNFLSKRFYHKVNGWVKFSITEELRDLIINHYIEVLGGRKQNELTENLKENLKTWGIYNRLVIELKKDKIKSFYIAGQDYISELNCLRNLIYKCEVY